MRAYEIKRYNTNDENAIEDFKGVLFLEEMSKETGTKEHSELLYGVYKKLYKTICNNIRDSIGTDNFIAIGFNKEQTEIEIVEFDMKATQEHHDWYFEEGKGFYFEIEQKN